MKEIEWRERERMMNWKRERREIIQKEWDERKIKAVLIKVIKICKAAKPLLMSASLSLGNTGQKNPTKCFNGSTFTYLFRYITANLSILNKLVAELAPDVQVGWNKVKRVKSVQHISFKLLIKEMIKVNIILLGIVKTCKIFIEPI